MSQAISNNENDVSKEESPFQKPRAGVYTVLLIVSFAALMVGSVCLHKEMERYDFQFSAESVNINNVKGHGTAPDDNPLPE